MCKYTLNKQTIEVRIYRNQNKQNIGVHIHRNQKWQDVILFELN